MTDRTRLAAHAVLMDRMADTQGIDLEEKVLRGQLRPDDLVDMVLACTGCTSPDRCGKWLDAPRPEGSAPPEYCRNIEAFDFLSEA